MMNNISSILSGVFSPNSYLRIGEKNNNIKLYVGKDEKSRYSFEFRGFYTPEKIIGSDVISVQQTKNRDEYSLLFSLERNELFEYFCIFCEDLLESTRALSDDNAVYLTLRSHYFSWKSLFRPQHSNLNESEIMGLIGELLFLRDEMFPLKGIDKALDSWSGPERTHKDFSFGEIWYEVKAKSFGKETVRISSVEQLDGDTDGVLAVYSLEKMSSNFNGLTLNTLVSDIITQLRTVSQKETFMTKLSMYGFDFSPENDNYVFAIRNLSQYKVDSINFPRARHNSLPDAIIRVQYEILLSKIEQYKIK